MPKGQTTKTLCNCIQCGTDFLVWPSQIKSGRKFCSHACSVQHALIPLIDRFSRHIGSPTPTGCIPWVGPLYRNGYGKLRSCTRYGRGLLAHRVAWEFAHGPIPDGLFVCHNCPGGDNRACINVAHLFLGTQYDNMADLIAKNRPRKIKLTADDVREIRKRYATHDADLKQLAREYGVCFSNISQIVNRLTWRHVK